jgi:hypothetical protein
MRIYRDLRDLSGSELVSALYFQRGGAALTFKPPASAGEIKAAAIS